MKICKVEYLIFPGICCSPIRDRTIGTKEWGRLQIHQCIVSKCSGQYSDFTDILSDVRYHHLQWNDNLFVKLKSSLMQTTCYLISLLVAMALRKWAGPYIGRSGFSSWRNPHTQSWRVHPRMTRRIMTSSDVSSRLGILDIPSCQWRRWLTPGLNYMAGNSWMWRQASTNLPTKFDFIYVGISVWFHTLRKDGTNQQVRYEYVRAMLYWRRNARCFQYIL